MRSAHESFVAAADRTILFYERLGAASGPVLVPLDGILWDGQIWRSCFEYFGRSCEIVHPHYRGHGRSGTPEDLSHATIEYLCTDLEAVLDHAGVRTVRLVGHSMGVQVALEFWRRCPERVEALVLCCGGFGRILDTFHEIGVVKLLFPAARLLLNRSKKARDVWNSVPAELAFRVATLSGEVNARAIRRQDMIPYLRNARYVDFTLFLNMVQDMDRHDTWSFLPRIDVPTLVIAAERDTFTPPRLAEAMARRIPNAELMVMPGATHAAPIENPAQINLRIEKFFLERLGSALRSERQP